jgi:hypothetical protein
MRSEKSKPAAITMSGFSLVGRWPKIGVLSQLLDGGEARTMSA